MGREKRIPATKIRSSQGSFQLVSPRVFHSGRQTFRFDEKLTWIDIESGTIPCESETRDSFPSFRCNNNNGTVS